jgi:hypothetical protein
MKPILETGQLFGSLDNFVGHSLTSPLSCTKLQAGNARMSCSLASLQYNLPILQCVIANIDADAAHNKGIAGEYEVTSYPTVMFFPRSTASPSSSEPSESNETDASKSKKTPIPYEGGRSEADFVQFLNEHCGTNRAVGGGLNDLAGLVPQLESHVLEFFATAEDKKQEIIASVKAEVSQTQRGCCKGWHVVRSCAREVAEGW